MHIKILSGILMIITSASSLTAVTIDKTPYGLAPLRLEARPDPLQFSSPEITAQMIKTVADMGVKAQWISVVDPNGNPYYKSSFLPSNLNDLDNREKLLKNAVADIHKQGMAAMSWYPLVLSQSSWQKHPEWRQQYMPDAIPGDQQDLWCCINSGYGDKLIDFCNEAIEKFDLDGIWFDGSAFTQIWHRPLPYSCICDSCKKSFKAQTGFDLPQKADWNNAAYRKWVAWRYDVFSSYIGRIAGEIRKKHPKATVAINHYHRPLIPWQGAIPIDLYKADIITGSEGFGEKIVDLTMRLNRAYGRSQSEVWMHLDNGSYTHHALTCVTAGGYPSYGGDPWKNKIAEPLKNTSEYLTKLAPYISGKSVSYAAIHVSQQTETFFLSRDRKGLNWETEPFWNILTGWTQGSMQSHISPDYIYDKSITLKNLKKYKVIIMPASFALSDKQCRTILRYAEQGGTVVLGPWTGVADEWGEIRKNNPLTDQIGMKYINLPSIKLNERKAVTILDANGKEIGSYPMLRSEMRIDDKWQTLYSTKIGAEIDPCVIQRTYGKGKIIASSIDMSDIDSKWTAGADGDTSIAISDDTSAVGKKSLKFIDGPVAAQTFFPDMEMYFAAIEPVSFAEGRFSCYLKLDKNASVVIENRESKPVLGTYVNIKSDGTLSTDRGKIGEIKVDDWFKIEIRFRITGENKTYDVCIQQNDGTETMFSDLQYRDANFERCNWSVLFGAGTEKSVFYADDIKIEGITGENDPQSILVFYDGFEETGDDKKLPASYISDDLLKTLPADIEIDAPSWVRTGAFYTGKSQIAIQLHNIRADEKDPKDGPSATVRTKLPISGVKTLFGDKNPQIRRTDDWNIVDIPSIPIHETVILEMK